MPRAAQAGSLREEEPGEGDASQPATFDVIIASEASGPRNLHFSNNVFPPGTRGVCNKELTP
jgi:hypothetical protein